MAKQTFTTGQVLTAAQMTSLQQTAMGGGSATAKTASYTLVAADAGTTVIMNSASATTITVNTSLFSAGDTVFLQNIGAGICTITAGTATVNTASSLALAQYESGNLYFTAAGASIFSKADGAAATGNTGLTLITTQTFSAVASQSINNCFSATYKNYRIVITGKNDTSTNVVRLRVRASGTDNTSSNYVSAGFEVTPNGGSGAIGCSTGTTYWHFGEMYTRTGLFIIDIANPFATEYTAFTTLNAGNDATPANSYIEFRGGNLTVTTSYDGFTIFPDANTITGRLEVYGYNQ